MKTWERSAYMSAVKPHKNKLQMKKQKINKISREGKKRNKEQKSVGKGENKSKADSGRWRKNMSEQSEGEE